MWTVNDLAEVALLMSKVGRMPLADSVEHVVREAPELRETVLERCEDIIIGALQAGNLS
jgi:hypothetical protein